MQPRAHCTLRGKKRKEGTSDERKKEKQEKETQSEINETGIGRERERDSQKKDKKHINDVEQHWGKKHAQTPAGKRAERQGKEMASERQQVELHTTKITRKRVHSLPLHWLHQQPVSTTDKQKPYNIALLLAY